MYAQPVGLMVSAAYIAIITRRKGESHITERVIPYTRIFGEKENPHNRIGDSICSTFEEEKDPRNTLTIFGA